MYALRVTFYIFYNLFLAYLCTSIKSQTHVCWTNSLIYNFVQVECFTSRTTVDIRVLFPLRYFAYFVLSTQKYRQYARNAKTKNDLTFPL